jgi:hypothetical protein
MKPQSKKMSIIESVTNTVIGLITSFYVQYLLFPFFGIHVSTGTNLKITAIFFVISFARSYGTRRIFNKINNHKKII